MGDEVASLKQQVQALKAKLAKDSETKKKLRTHVDLLKEKAINLGVIITELQSVKQDKAALQQECERLSAALAAEQQRVHESVQRQQLTAQQKSQKEQQFFELAREKQQLQSRWAAHERELQQLQKQLHEAVQSFVARLVDRIAGTLRSGCESKRNIGSDCHTAMVGLAAAAYTGATATAGIAGAVATAAVVADREAWLWQCAVSQPVLLALQAALAAVAQYALLAGEQGAALGSSSSSSTVLCNSPVTNAVGCDDGLAQSTSRLCGASTCAQTLMYIMKQLALAQQAANAQQHEAERQQQRQHHQPEADSVHGAVECSAPSLEQLVPMLLGLLQHLLHQRCLQKQQVRQAGSGHKAASVSQAERALAGALCAALKLATAALPKVAVQQLLCSPLEDILQTTAGTAAPVVKSTAASQAVVTGAVCAASPVTAAAADCPGGSGSSDVNNHVKSVVRQLQQAVGHASCATAGEQHI
eukprot:gene13105-13233_t